ncbi:MAG: Rieske 2Fe-2S domain-containing protein, partial [Gammaproteobacteria bacterium]
MSSGKGYWCPVLASDELGKRPIGRTRFGQKLVFWRSEGQVVCMPDQCPHRGAALSLGRINKDTGALICPFHGLQFSAAGRCVHIPVEDDPFIPDDFGVTPLVACEADGYIWIWRGAAIATAALPAVPKHSAVEGMRFGEATGIWNAHYTRCIENVCDFSHVPFVHRTTIGLVKRDTFTNINMEDVPGGFRAHLVR